MIPQIKTSLKSFVKECAGRRSPATTEPRIWRLKNKRHFLLCSILHLKTVCSVENSLSYSVFLLCAPENLCCYNDIILTKIPIETAIRDRISISIMGNNWVEVNLKMWTVSFVISHVYAGVDHIWLHIVNIKNPSLTSRFIPYLFDWLNL